MPSGAARKAAGAAPGPERGLYVNQGTFTVEGQASSLQQSNDPHKQKQDAERQEEAAAFLLGPDATPLRS